MTGLTRACLFFLIAGTAFAQDEYVQRDEVTPHGLAPSMKVIELKSAPGTRSFQVLMSKGDEVASGLLDFAEKNHIKNAHFTGLGAFDHAVLGWYNLDKRLHKKLPIDQEMEVSAFTGNITVDRNGKYNVHAHCVVGISDGSARAGHFVMGHVSLVMQIYVEDSEPLVAAPAVQATAAK
jgi:predicted DNA-binding protein with PD1-like motif